MLSFPGMMAVIEGMQSVLPGLRRSVVIYGGGHWVQQERAPEVNAALLEFLGGL